MRPPKNKSMSESGIALLTTLLLMLLIFSLVAGFVVLVMSGQQLTGLSKGQTTAFYAAEAGMEKLTADLGTLFDTTYAPSAAQLAVIPQSPPILSGIAYIATDGSSGYKMTYPQDSQGNPQSSNQTIKAGAYYGMVGLVTPYTLTVTARTTTGAEVMLRRTTQTVGIPAFQFGVFSDKDLGFHAGPDFNFGGRVHTNGNLFLAEGGGGTLTLSDKVTAYGEVVRTNISNGLSLATGGWTGTVNVTTGPSTPSRNLATNEGSVVGASLPSMSAPNPNWTTISNTYYNDYLINHLTGVNQRLKLPIEILTNGQSTPIDILRRPTQGEAGNPALLGERYFAQASMKILLSDNANDIMQLPCVDTATQPVDLTTLAWDASFPKGLGYPSAANPDGLPAWYTLGKANPIPMATSAATVARTGGLAGPVPAAGYATGNGYWIPKYDPIITGFLKIEIQIGYISPCGKWQDVTQEILNLGIAGRNLNPGLKLTAANINPALTAVPGPQVQIAPSSCPDPSPNAVIRLERVRDNPSNALAVGNCGVNTTVNPPVPSTLASDYWPNVLFDTREGTIRDVCPNGTSPCSYSQVMAGGVMHYVELDVKNLARWFTGQIGTKGPGAFDPQNAPYDFVVYFSDRRGNYTPPGSITTAWPPVSPSLSETGEYGFSDFVNPNDAANGCPDGLLNGLPAGGEDVAEKAIFYNYGQTPSILVTARLFGDALANATVANPNCSSPKTIWPGYFVKNPQTARMNPPLFFRRALKLVNGNNIYTSMSAAPCPGSIVCGLTVASENPVYVQGDYNANSAGGGFNDAHVATSVLADAFTFLSNNFNDVNSFSSPYDPGSRNAVTTWFRVAVLAGKGPSFAWISGTNSDTGSDGGVHNFLRYVENWGPSGVKLNYRGSIVSMFFNRQATGIFKCCNTVYSPPNRGYNFETEFLTPSLLPPRTPMFRDINTTGFTQLIYPEQH
jgi:hypothetical protein